MAVSPVRSGILISFCIPAHNEEDCLPGTLAAIRLAAQGLYHEIVVADDASTDRTATIAREVGAVVVTIDRRQIAASRNAAARASRGDVLFFVDADTRATPGAVTEALAAIRAGAVGGGGPVTFDGEIPRYAKILLPTILFLFRLAKLSGGAFMFCTRDAFEKSGGWDETFFAGEEIEFAKALKQHGPFVVVRTPVVTSGRKLRTCAPGQLLGVCWRMFRTLGKAAKTRDGLDVWYAPRPPDPGAA